MSITNAKGTIDGKVVDVKKEIMNKNKRISIF